MKFDHFYGNVDKLEPQGLYYAFLASVAAYSAGDSFPNALRDHLGLTNYYRDAVPGEVPSHVAVLEHANGRTVAIEGTQNIRDWMHNANFSLLTGLPTAHGRVVSVYRQCALPIINKILAMPNPNFPLFLTGHSRGGAVAIVVAAELRLRGLNVRNVVTFGSPKVGTADFANDCITPCLNVRTWQDPIPFLPPGNVRLWSPLGALTGMIGDTECPGIDVGIGPPETLTERAARLRGYALYIAGLNSGFVAAHSVANYYAILTEIAKAITTEPLKPLVAWLSLIARDWNYT